MPPSPAVWLKAIIQATEPVDIEDFQLWINPTTGAIKLRNASDLAFVDLGGAVGGGSAGLNFPQTAPVLGDFTQVNFGSASAVTTSKGYIHLSAPSNGGAQNWRMLAKALPAAPYTVTWAYLPLLARLANSLAGFGLRDSGTGALVVFKIAAAGAVGLEFSFEKWSSAAVFASAYIAAGALQAMPWPLVFMRFQDDLTNRIFSWSTDGENFLPIHSVGRTDFLTPDQVFVGVNPFDQPAAITIVSTG